MYPTTAARQLQQTPRWMPFGNGHCIVSINKGGHHDKTGCRQSLCVLQNSRGSWLSESVVANFWRAPSSEVWTDSAQIWSKQFSIEAIELVVTTRAALLCECRSKSRIYLICICSHVENSCSSRCTDVNQFWLHTLNHTWKHCAKVCFEYIDVCFLNVHMPVSYPHCHHKVADHNFCWTCGLVHSGVNEAHLLLSPPPSAHL